MLNSGTTIELPEGVSATLVTLPTNQSWDKTLTFLKRQELSALIIINEQNNESFIMEIDIDFCM